jgi:hypothetical protein
MYPAKIKRQVLLEHSPAPAAGDGEETLDLVLIGADGSRR